MLVNTTLMDLRGRCGPLAAVCVLSIVLLLNWWAVTYKMRFSTALYHAALGAVTVNAAAANCGGLRKMENLITFGDSYTDEDRFAYFLNHNYQPPPPGTLLPPSNETNSGGKAWGRFVAESTGATYYNYAVAGAMCSDKVAKHHFGDKYFPSVKEYQVPAYKADLAFAKLYPNRKASNTAYAVWIGTNDLGVDGFLNDKQEPGKSISDFVECVFQTFDAAYESGGRYFVLLNEAPLHVAPLYAAPTETSNKMFEYTTSTNTMFDYGAPFNLLVKKRWPGATFVIYNVHQLMLDIHDNPSQYLTPPAIVKDPYRVCDNNGCKDSTNPRSSYMW